MLVSFENKLLIGVRSWIGKDGKTRSGGVLYDPETSETLAFTSELQLKDSLKPLKGTLNIEIKGGKESWTKISLISTKPF